MRAFPNFRRHRIASTATGRGIIAAGIVLALAATVGSARAEVLRTGGTGAVTKMLLQVATAFAEREPGFSLVVMPSLGSAGGIAGVVDGLLDFAVSGRPLNPEEAKSVTAIVLASTPFCLVSSQPNPGNIKSADIASFYLNVASVWPDGTPVRVVLRPRVEVDAAMLVNTFPKMAEVIEQLRERKEIPVTATDQDNVLLAEKIAGSLAAVTLTQMVTENAHLHLLAIDGVEPTLDNFERGTYPYHKDFYFVFPHDKKPVTERFIAFMRSPDGEKLLRESGTVALQP
jgi:phosphate transport system substrate-binding protein